jgi:hypothetical protein
MACSSSASQAATINGKVADMADSKGIPAVHISAYNGQKQVVATTKTDADGDYQITVPAGVLELRYEKLKYQERPTIVYNVATTEGQLVTRNVEMLREGAGKAYYDRIAGRTSRNFDSLRRLELISHTMPYRDKQILEASVYRLTSRSGILAGHE